MAMNHGVSETRHVKEGMRRPTLTVVTRSGRNQSSQQEPKSLGLTQGRVFRSHGVHLVINSEMYIW